MAKIQLMFSKMLASNFTGRRFFTLLLAFVCLVVCFLSVMGWIQVSLLATVGVLVLGLILIEWAG